MGQIFILGLSTDWDWMKKINKEWRCDFLSRVVGCVGYNSLQETLLSPTVAMTTQPLGIKIILFGFVAVDVK